MEDHTDVLIGYPESVRASSKVLMRNYSSKNSLQRLDSYFNDPETSQIQKQLQTIEVVPEVSYDSKQAVKRRTQFIPMLKYIR
jgi:hypothetical protein